MLNKLFRSKKIQKDDNKFYEHIQLEYKDPLSDIEKIKQNYGLRFEVLQKQYETKVEAVQDMLFNIAVTLNERKEKLINKKINESLKDLLTNEQIEYKYKNLELTRIQADEMIKKNELDKKRLIAAEMEKSKEEIEKIDNLIQYKRHKYKAKIERLKKSHERYMKRMQRSADNKMAKLTTAMEHVEKHHNLNFIEQKDKLNSSLVTVNKKINSELNNLELKYSNRELPISKYEVTKKKLIDSYKQKVDQLTKVAQTTYKNFTSKIWNWKFTSRFEEDRLRNVGKRALLAANASKLLFLFLFIAIITAFQSPNYFSSYNWFIAILKSNVFIGFIAMGETLAILTAGIDLSVGSLIGFGATLYLYFTVSLGMHFILSLVLMIVIMVILGFTNGFLISKFKIPPFIITLAGLLTLRGGINVILKGTPISNLNDPIFNFLNTDLGNNFHVLLLIFIIVAVVAVFLLKYTKSGRYIYAVGDNPEAAKISGIKNNWILMLVYGFSATFAIGGALSAASLTTSVSPNTGFGFELDAITAVVLGGTALSGGKGGIGKTIIGWFAVAILLNSFAFFNVDSNYQQIAKGLIIIVAVIFNKNTRIIERLKKLYLKTLKYRILIVNHKKIY